MTDISLFILTRLSDDTDIGGQRNEKIIGIIALTMVFALAACDLGNTEDPNSDNPDTSQTDDQGNNSQGGQ